MILDNYPENLEGITLDRGEGRYTVFEDVQALIATIRDNSKGNIIEVGCAIGITTKDLANHFPDRRIYAIDSTQNDIHDGQKGEKPNTAIICSHGRPYSNVSVIDESSRDVDYSKTENVGAIFIDGDHTYEGVKIDSERIIQFFTGKDVLIMWHDYYDVNPHDWIGVRKYIDENIANKYELHRILGTNIVWMKI